jgi:hypothetical protein
MFFGLLQRRPRTQRVVVAVVYDRQREKFLVIFNARWGGYTFPMRRFRTASASDALLEREYAVREARRAFSEDLGADLGRASEAHWMDRIEVPGVSGRTGERTLYLYDIVTLVPARPLPEGSFAGRFGFLTAQEIRDSDPDEPGPAARVVTWTTWQVLTRLLDNQQVAVAIVRRERNGQIEYLLTRNRHDQWFFPATRLGDQVPPKKMVIYEFKIKANYPGRMVVPEDGPAVDLEQDTPHLGPRSYLFHLREVRFPEEDLTMENNRLEAALNAAGVECDWRSEADLKAGGPDLSDTIRGLLPEVLALGQ